MAYQSSRQRPSKRLGQNFLVDPNVALDIVSAARLTQSDKVLEPGPGHGTLTRLLQKRAGTVIAVEKDPGLAHELREMLREHSNVIIIEGDVLKTTLPPFNKIVSTPPYYLSSKLILFLVNSKFELASMVFQKEFGERLVAEPGTADYGRLTVTTQRNLEVEKISEVPRTVFHPRPKVDSILLRLTPKEERKKLDEVLFEEMVRGIFTQRRRLLRGALRHFLALKLGRDAGKSIMDKIAVTDARVYQLSVEELENLCLSLSDALPMYNPGPQTLSRRVSTPIIYDR